MDTPVRTGYNAAPAAASHAFSQFALRADKSASRYDQRSEKCGSIGHNITRPLGSPQGPFTTPDTNPNAPPFLVLSNPVRTVGTVGHSKSTCKASGDVGGQTTEPHVALERHHSGQSPVHLAYDSATIQVQIESVNEGSLLAQH